MEDDDGVHERMRRMLLHCFRKGKNALEAQRRLRAEFGYEAYSEKQCTYWFARFRFGDVSLIDNRQYGRPGEIDKNYIKAIIDSDPHCTRYDIAEKLNTSETSIKKKIRKMGYVKKHGLWVLRESNSEVDTN